MALVAKIILVISAIALIIAVLLQSGKSPGLGGVIGGGNEQMVGKQKARGMDAVLNKVTVVFAVLFMVSAVLLAFFLQG
ncbi:preprotein translocase subunit SecG [Brevibacillus daliensis]|uniref:preprotein translocase subunit SecG n=1 Tax=Brevibacillus daliensis TaxID=2892995 RepID=UPI001E51E3EA|nr:preprotein translocase subunit SecG [Brevibacillus daliensis]